LHRDDEIITPSQITLLKLVDSYLQTNPQLTPERQVVGVTIMEQLNPMLSTSFLALSTYAQEAIHRALAPTQNEVKSNAARSKGSAVLSSTRCRQKPKNADDQEMTGSAWFEESPNVSDADESREQPKPRRSLKISELEDLSRSFTPPTELDVLLPKVCEALVLIIQCIVTISAKMEDGMTSSGKAFQDIFNQSLSVDGQGLIESLVGA
jgi:ataxin-10